MATLDVYLNGYLVGEFKKSNNGGHTFSYSKRWLALKGSRLMSLSIPLVKCILIALSFIACEY